VRGARPCARVRLERVHQRGRGHAGRAAQPQRRAAGRQRAACGRAGGAGARAALGRLPQVRAGRRRVCVRRRVGVEGAAGQGTARCCAAGTAMAASCELRAALARAQHEHSGSCPRARHRCPEPAGARRWPSGARWRRRGARRVPRRSTTRSCVRSWTRQRGSWRRWRPTSAGGACPRVSLCVCVCRCVCVCVVVCLFREGYGRGAMRAFCRPSPCDPANARIGAARRLAQLRWRNAFAVLGTWGQASAVQSGGLGAGAGHTCSKVRVRPR
jgi:hypothetical protein